MTNLRAFKQHICELLKIAEWNPTDVQLTEIARQFAQAPPKDVTAAGAIVRSVCPPESFFAHEGVDNSDLRALLALAIAAAKK